MQYRCADLSTQFLPSNNRLLLYNVAFCSARWMHHTSWSPASCIRCSLCSLMIKRGILDSELLLWCFRVTALLSSSSFPACHPHPLSPQQGGGAPPLRLPQVGPSRGSRQPIRTDRSSPPCPAAVGGVTGEPQPTAEPQPTGDSQPTQ